MFYDRPDCIKLADGIYLFKNFINKDKVEKVYERLSGLEQNAQYEASLIDWYKEKMTPQLIETFPIWEDLSELLAPSHVIHPAMNITVLKPGDGGMFAHSDSPGRDMEEDLSQLDTWSTCCVLDYGVIAYFGEWEGGELEYGNFNPDGTEKTEGNIQEGSLQYKPEQGDVVIHGATDKWVHGVKEVISGTRYAFSNFCLQAIDNPGSFYNYNTSEYINQIGNKTEQELLDWAKPLKDNDYIEIIKQRVLSEKL